MLISEYLQEIANLKEKIRDLERLIPPPKPRYTLRSVIWAIRYLVRLTRLLARKDLKAVGRLGYNELLRRQEKVIKLLTNGNEKLQRRVQIADESFLFQAAELESYRAVLQEKRVELVDHVEIKQVLRRTQSLLRAAEREKEEVLALSAETVEAQNVVINQRVHVALEVQHDYHLQQAKVYAQIQRNLGHHLAQSLFRVRSVISSMDIDSEMPKLTKKYEPSPVISNNASFSVASEWPSSKPAGGGTSPAVMLPKLKAKQLALAVKTRSRQLIAWIKKNRRLAVLMPKKVPVILFKEPSGSTARNEIAARKQKARELSVMTHVIRNDFDHVEDVRKMADADIRKVQDYVLAMKDKHNELLQVIKGLEEELREERMPSQSTRAPRKRIGDIKSSFSHLINSTDPDHQNSYFSNVLSAIETVQAEHGDVYKEKLVKSGKFKLSDVANMVVRRASVSSKGGGSTVHMRGGVSSKSDKIGFEDASPGPSRTTSICMPTGGYPLSKLDSLVEIDHEHHEHDHPDHADHHDHQDQSNHPRFPVLPTIASASAASASSSLQEASVEKLNTQVPELNPLQPPSIILEDFAEDDHLSSKKYDAVDGAGGKGNMWIELGLQESSVLSEGTTTLKENTASGGMSPNKSGNKNRGKAFLVPAIEHALPSSSLTAGPPVVALEPSAVSRLTDDMKRSDVDHEQHQPAASTAAAAGQVSFGKLGASALQLQAPSQTVRSSTPPHPLKKEESTIGFEPDDDGDNEGKERVSATAGADEEEDEDVLYMVDLMAAKDEMVGLLTREEVIQNKIKAAEEYKQMLEGQVKDLEWRLEKKVIEYEQLEVRVLTIGGEQKQLQTEFETLTHENTLLREIVEEDYRHHAANLEKALQEREERERNRLRRNFPTVNQSTQVSCAVCAIREEGLQHTTSSAGAGGHRMSHSRGYDDATVAMVNESFTRALNGEVVLIAKPRRINGPPKQARASSAVSEPTRPPVIAFEEIKEGIRTMELARTSKAFGCALTLEGGGAAPQLDRNSPGFSEALIKHMESNQFQSMMNSNSAGNSKPSSANRNAATVSSTVGTGEGSKFSRIKKMPPKGSSSSGDLLHNSGGQKGGLPPTVRPHSAVAPSQKKNLGQRTESNTAAYLQNQLMGGYSSSPQFAPMYTESIVPLHTVDASSGRPDSTAAYLAHAVSKQRASSASAARTEHTSSANLLLNTVEERSQEAGSVHSSKGNDKEAKIAKKLQLDLRMPGPRQGTNPHHHHQQYIADITDEMSDGAPDEFF